MTVSGVLSVVRVEGGKLIGQMKTRIVLAACVVGPFVFAGAIRVQSSLPTDTLFGRAVKESGFAISLVILGFAALWAFPVLTSVVGGDVFSAEDRYGTWKMVLTRSRSRADVFAGKVIVALVFSCIAVLTLAISSVAAGLLVIGTSPLINLSGMLVQPADAWQHVALAWISVIPPALGFTALAVLLSVTSRSSVFGVGIPVIVGLVMQLAALLDGPELIRRVMITSAFGAWHGLLADPPYYRPIFHGAIVSAAYFIVCLAIAYRALRRRDIAG